MVQHPHANLQGGGLGSMSRLVGLRLMGVPVASPPAELNRVLALHVSARSAGELSANTCGGVRRCGLKKRRRGEGRRQLKL